MIGRRLRCCAMLSSLIVLTAGVGVPALGAASEDAAREAAVAFGRALTRADAAGLRPLLPERGKVRLRLHCFGPEEGTYSAGQVVALFQEFFRKGAVRTFEVTRVESDPHGYAVVQSRLQAIGRDGQPQTFDLRLTLQAEGARWVLSEIRETPP